jgi:MFS family permease
MMSFLGTSARSELLRSGRGFSNVQPTAHWLASASPLPPDRINIGVAKLNGLEKELGLNSLQYSTASLVFFATYCFFEIPSNMLLKRFRPSRWISFLAITWGITMTCMGLVRNFGQLVALRVLLGMLEAG